MKLLQYALRLDVLVHLIAVVPRLPQIIAVQVVVSVDFNDAIDEIIECSIVEKVQKTEPVKIQINQGIAPVNGQAIDLHRLKDFFSRVARLGAVLEGDGELVAADEFELVLYRATDVIHQPSA